MINISRSFKRHPVSKDNQRGGAQYAKRRSAHRSRNLPVESEDGETLMSSRSAFKKIFRDQYDIHDYVYRWSKEQAIAEYEEMMRSPNPEEYQYYWAKNFTTLESFLNYWEKCVKRK